MVDLSPEQNKIMNSIDNFYKLKCAKLEEERKQLLQQLAYLEEIAMTASAGVAGQAQPSFSPSTESPTSGSRRKGRKPAEKPEMQEDPLDPKAQHGLEPYGVGEYALRDVLQKYSDNPTTPEFEMPQQATWQATNTAIGNYMQGEVERLKRMHGMI